MPVHERNSNERSVRHRSLRMTEEPMLQAIPWQGNTLTALDIKKNGRGNRFCTQTG